MGAKDGEYRFDGMSQGAARIGVVSPGAAGLWLALQHGVLALTVEHVGRGQPAEPGPGNDDADVLRPGISACVQPALKN